MRTAHSVPALLHLAHLASLSPLYAQMLFWSYIIQGNTRIASFIQLAAEQNRPAAQVFSIETRKRVA